MILSDEGIRNALARGEIEIDPPPKPDQYQTSAVDIFLGDSFRIWDLPKFNVPGVRVELNLAQQRFVETAAVYSCDAPREGDGSVILPPWAVVAQVMLCQTRERIHLKPESRLAARVEGRSSLARLGLMVHLTAPTIHAGFNATITLELINNGPFFLRLIPTKTRICQFISSGWKLNLPAS